MPIIPKIPVENQAPSLNGQQQDLDEDARLYEIARDAALMTSPVEPIHVVFEPITEESGRTESAHALRFVERWGDLLRYVIEWKDWLVWDGRHWKRDIGGIEVQDRAWQTATDLWREIAGIKSNDWLRKQMVAFALKSNTAIGISNTASLARIKLPISVSRLDTNPWLLNAENGTIDLQTGKLSSPCQKDYNTKLCPTQYVPSAQCPTWLRFLNQVLDGNQELIDYLQLLLGYCITGNVSEQILPVLWGEGSNGKSTLVNTITYVFGTDYSGTPPRELFSLSKSERHPTQLMTLHGKRLAAAQETDAGAKLNEALIKHLTGGDTVTARGVYENFCSFTPTHKLLLSTNHKPKVVGTDYAIWRRLKLIEFKVKFEGKRADHFLQKKLEAEAEGILAWLIRGCLEWQKRGGLEEPECVRVATEAYRTEQDELGTFLKERCELGPDYEVISRDLLRAYKEWSSDNDITAPVFGKEISKRGFTPGMITKGIFKGHRTWKGLRIVTKKLVIEGKA